MMTSQQLYSGTFWPAGGRSEGAGLQGVDECKAKDDRGVAVVVGGGGVRGLMC